MNRVVWESRHKFVYYDYDSIESLRWLANDYMVEMNKEEPIVIYEIIEPLPKVDTNLRLDTTMIRRFHECYYELVIFLAIVNELFNRINENLLNDRLKRVFDLCSFSGKKEINDVRTLISLLIDSQNMYKEAYEEYMKTGKCDFYDRVPIPFIMLDNMVPYLKKAIGLKKHFALMLEFEGVVSLFNSMAINDYIASRCNGYLSFNVLLESDSYWNSFYANNGQLIQETHDYTELDFRKNKTKRRGIQK